MSEAGYRQLGGVIRGKILEAFHTNSCIATTRATVDVLRARGQDVYPLVVNVMIANEELVHYAREHDGRYPEAGSPDYPPGGFAIGIGWGVPVGPLDFTSHLVAVAERRWMLDYSIDQASRPEYGIELVPLTIPVTEAFLRGREMVTYRWGKSFLTYQALPGDKSYRVSPNWDGATAPVTRLTVTR